MATISQGIATPSGLASGQIADANQITPLYAALNAFIIPDNLLPLQVALVDNSTTSLDVSVTTTKDWALTTQIPITSYFYIVFPFGYFNNNNNDLTLTYRLNGFDMTAGQVISGFAGPASAMTWVLGGPMEVSGGTLLGIQGPANSTIRTFTNNTSIAISPITTVGIRVSGTAGNITVQDVRVVAQQP